MQKEGTTLCWLGHSCFLIEKDGYRIVLDPYADGTVSGYGPLRVDADQVLCSHQHDDHNAVSCVTLRPDRDQKTSPFTITQLESWHDEAQGRKRGPNTIRIIDDGTYRIAHMGDLGCMPSPEQKEQLRGLDVCLVPVGGFFTMKPELVHKLMEELAPTVVVPMHYRFKQNGRSYGMMVIAPVDHYLKRCSSAIRYNRNYLTFPDDLKPQTAVLTLGSTGK